MTLWASEHPKYSWAELNCGLIGCSFAFNVANGTQGWRGSASSYNQGFLSNIVDKESKEIVSTNLMSLALLRNWTLRSKIGYLNAGVGISYVKGKWGVSCRDYRDQFGTNQLCEIKKVSTVGVPIHISAIFGRHIGFGLFANALITSSTKSGLIGISIPIGIFTN